AAKSGSPASPAAQSASGASAATNGGGTPDTSKLSPSVRRLVEENKLDPSGIPASGRDGRLTKSDVVDYLDKTAKAPQPAPTAPAPAAKPSTPAGPRTARAEHRVAMTRLRQRIAALMAEVQST